MSYTVNQQSAPITSSLIDSAGASDDPTTEGLLRRISNKRKEPDTIQYLESLFERAKTARWRFERQWYVNLSYYFGRQWINWINGGSPDIARLYEPQAPPWRVRLVVNRIKPALRRELSKTMKEKPTAFVIPATTDDSDVAAAKAGEAIFEHLWRTLHMKDELWIAQFWRAVSGTGFIKDWWDPRSEGEDGVGSIGLEVVTPFHLYFSNLEQYNIEKQEYIIHVSMKSPQEVETVYGIKVTPDTVERGGGVVESQYLRAMSLDPGKVSQVAVKEIWIKPNVRFPAGAMFIWAAGKILFCSEDPMTGDPRWPLYKKEYPFTKFDGVPTGRFYGDSSIVDILPIQKEYNRTRSQIIEAKNQMSKPQLLAAKGSIDPNKITSEPGLVIFYQPGFEKPTPLPLAPLPNYVMAELDRSLQDISDISGQHEVSTGTVPAGVTAASALSFLQEQDDTMMAPIIQSLESGIERLGKHFLCHVQQWWDEPHAVKVIGPDNTWEIKEFTKADLKENTDLNIQAGSAMPRSLAAKQAFIMELIKLQVITPDRGLRYLEMAETSQMYEETQVDRRHAERENMKMSDPSMLQPELTGLFDNFFAQQGGDMQTGAAATPTGALMGGLAPPAPGMPPQPPVGELGPGPEMPMDPSMMGGDPSMGGPPIGGDPAMGGMPPMMPEFKPLPMVPVNTWDNHEVHIETHNMFRKRQEFENLDPRLQEEFERHVEMHRSALGMPPSINPEQMRQIMQFQSMMPQPPALEGGAPTNEPGALPPEGTQAPGDQPL